MDVKLGLIGGGYWGKNLIRDFNSLGVLDTICDVNKDALATYNELYPEVKTTTDWSDILNDPNINSVCIALPAEMHYKFAKDALLMNKDVYVEKPITLDVSEAEELIDIAERNNLILMVGHLLHYHPCVMKIKEMIKEGAIGNVKNIVCNRLNLGIFRTQENVLWSFAPHDISVALSLCDNKMPDSVSCKGFSHVTKGIHDITNSVLSYPDKYININVNWLNPYKEQRMSIIGDKGMLLFDDTLKENKLMYYPEHIRYDNGISPIPKPVKNNGIAVDVDLSRFPLVIECEHFIKCCVHRTIPITNGSEGVRVLKVLRSLQDSLESGKDIIMESSKFYVHPSAVVDDGALIGEGTHVWHFSHISKGAKIGKNCNIGQNVYIASNVIIGDNCKVQNNVSIYTGVVAEDDVFFGPSCVLTNDLNPRCAHSKNGAYIKTILRKGCTLGANSTIVCGNEIGEDALIGAGAVVTKDVPPNAVVVGNPAKQIKSIDDKGNMW